jgi:hypothetical protein
MSGFALFNIVNILIIMILNDLCLLPALFLYIVIYVRNLESHMQIADRCAPWKVSNGAQNPVLQALQFQQLGFCRKLSGGTGIGHYRPNQCFHEG